MTTICINSIEHCIDEISDSLVMTPSSVSQTKSPASTPRSDSNKSAEHNANAKSADYIDGKILNSGDICHGQFVIDESKKIVVKSIPYEAQTPEGTFSERKFLCANGGDKRKELQHLEGFHQNAFTQLAKVDFYETESRTQTPGTSSQSSPASIHPKKSRSQKSSSAHGEQNPLSVPPLDLDLSDSENSFAQTPSHGKHYNMLDNTNPSRNAHREQSQSKTHHLSYASRKTDPVSPTWEPSTKTYTPSQSQGHEEEEVDASPRERLKMIEARVRLANWASSGQMPWKSTSDDDSADEKGNGATDMNSFTPSFKKSNPSQERFMDHQKSLSANVNREKMTTPGAEFRLPGKEAEEFISSVKRQNKRHYENRPASSSLNVMSKRESSTVADGYASDDSSSNESNFSLITLQPDGTQSKMDLQKCSHPLQRYEDNRLQCREDYNRIKAAVLNTEAKKTARTPVPGMMDNKLGKPDLDSDSDDSQVFMQLPTSTPTKKTPKKFKTPQGPTKDEKSEYGMRQGNQRAPEILSSTDDWKTVKTKVDPSEMVHPAFQASTQSTRRRLDIAASDTKRHGSAQRSKSVERPAVRERLRGRTPDPSMIPQDKSGITWNSADHFGGGGLWRYKSLEDILNSGDSIGREESSLSAQRLITAPISGDRFPDNNNDDSEDPVRHDFRGRNMMKYYHRSTWEEAETMERPSRRQQERSDPIQAMNSDFWAQQTSEDNEIYDDGLTENERKRLNFKVTPFKSKANKYKHTGAYSNEVLQFRGKERDTERQYKNITPLKDSKALYQPASSSEPRQAASFRRRKSSNSHWNQNSGSFDDSHNAHSTLPNSFAVHVNDVRKSLEAMENASFMKRSPEKKSKMKRSTSEQSLHLLQGDQESALSNDRYQRQSDIDDLISVYAKAPVSQSYFDLHNFGVDSLF